MTGHRGGVRMRREIRCGTLAIATLGSSPKSMSLCVLYTSVHFLLTCPFVISRIGRCKVAALTMHAHFIVNTPSLF